MGICSSCFRISTRFPPTRLGVVVGVAGTKFGNPFKDSRWFDFQATVSLRITLLRNGVSGKFIRFCEPGRGNFKNRREVGDGFRGQPPFEAKRISSRHKRCGAMERVCHRRQWRDNRYTGMAASLPLLAENQLGGGHPFSGCKRWDRAGSVHCLMIVSSAYHKAKKTRCAEASSQMRHHLAWSDRQNPIPIRELGAIPHGDRAAL